MEPAEETGFRDLHPQDIAMILKDTNYINLMELFSSGLGKGLVDNEAFWMNYYKLNFSHINNTHNNDSHSNLHNNSRIHTALNRFQINKIVNNKNYNWQTKVRLVCCSGTGPLSVTNYTVQGKDIPSNTRIPNKTKIINVINTVYYDHEFVQVRQTNFGLMLLTKQMYTYIYSFGRKVLEQIMLPERIVKIIGVDYNDEIISTEYYLTYTGNIIYRQIIEVPNADFPVKDFREGSSKNTNNKNTDKNIGYDIVEGKIVMDNNQKVYNILSYSNNFIVIEKDEDNEENRYMEDISLLHKDKINYVAFSKRLYDRRYNYETNPYVHFLIKDNDLEYNTINIWEWGTIGYFFLTDNYDLYYIKYSSDNGKSFISHFDVEKIWFIDSLLYTYNNKVLTKYLIESTNQVSYRNNPNNINNSIISKYITLTALETSLSDRIATVYDERRFAYYFTYDNATKLWSNKDFPYAHNIYSPFLLSYENVITYYPEIVYDTGSQIVVKYTA